MSLESLSEDNSSTTNILGSRISRLSTHSKYPDIFPDAGKKTLCFKKRTSILIREHKVLQECLLMHSGVGESGENEIIKDFKKCPLIPNGTWAHIPLNWLTMMTSVIDVINNAIKEDDITIIYQLQESQKEFYMHLVNSVTSYSKSARRASISPLNEAERCIHRMTSVRSDQPIDFSGTNDHDETETISSGTPNVIQWNSPQQFVNSPYLETSDVEPFHQLIEFMMCLPTVKKKSFMVQNTYPDDDNNVTADSIDSMSIRDLIRNQDADQRAEDFKELLESNLEYGILLDAKVVKGKEADTENAEFNTKYVVEISDSTETDNSDDDTRIDTAYDSEYKLGKYDEFVTENIEIRDTFEEMETDLDNYVANLYIAQQIQEDVGVEKETELPENDLLSEFKNDSIYEFSEEQPDVDVPKENIESDKYADIELDDVNYKSITETEENYQEPNIRESIKDESEDEYNGDILDKNKTSFLENDTKRVESQIEKFMIDPNRHRASSHLSEKLEIENLLNDEVISLESSDKLTANHISPDTDSPIIIEDNFIEILNLIPPRVSKRGKIKSNIDKEKLFETFFKNTKPSHLNENDILDKHYRVRKYSSKQHCERNQINCDTVKQRDIYFKGFLQPQNEHSRILKYNNRTLKTSVLKKKTSKSSERPCRGPTQCQRYIVQRRIRKIPCDNAINKLKIINATFGCCAVKNDFLNEKRDGAKTRDSKYPKLNRCSDIEKKKLFTGKFHIKSRNTASVNDVEDLIDVFKVMPWGHVVKAKNPHLFYPRISRSKTNLNERKAFKSTLDLRTINQNLIHSNGIYKYSKRIRHCNTELKIS